jgi:AcrR family transcriptional regulator
VTSTGTPPAQRSRILDAALELVSELGAAGTSMRRLATACGLNVATIYHYFPSKADLLRALIEERRYGERMTSQAPPLDGDLAPAERLAAMTRWLIDSTLAEQRILRLLVGEGLRADDTARRSTTELLDALAQTSVSWVRAGFPELPDEGRTADAVAALLRTTLLAAVTEHLVTGRTDARAHGDALAAVVFG